MRRLQLVVDVYDEETFCPFFGAMSDRKSMRQVAQAAATKTFGKMHAVTGGAHSAGEGFSGPKSSQLLAESKPKLFRPLSPVLNRIFTVPLPVFYRFSF